jgi:hypothetical protein
VDVTMQGADTQPLPERGCIGLDTGCVARNKLTAMVIEENKPGGPVYQLRQVDSQFLGRLLSMAARHFLKKWFLPFPVRCAVTLWNAAGYWRA